MSNKILIVGMGYVGLTLSASLVKNTKLKIVGLDSDSKIISDLKKGICHIFEPNMEIIIRKAIKEKRIFFLNKLRNNLKFKTIIICVGTPIKNENKEVMNDSIIASCNQIKPSMQKECLVILRSTVKIGTTRNIVKKILDNEKISYNLSYCPERTIEGNAIYELNHLPQIIASEDKQSQKRTKIFFKLFNKNLVLVDRFEKAELIKLIDNSYRDTFFSISNEIGLICKKLGFASNEIIKKANYKFKRTNLAITGPVGGPCLSKDPYILDQSCKKNFKSIFYYGRKVNEKLINFSCSEIEEIIKSNFVKKKINIIIFGAAFKCYPRTNDIRFSAAIDVVNHIKKNCSHLTYNITTVYLV